MTGHQSGGDQFGEAADVDLGVGWHRAGLQGTHSRQAIADTAGKTESPTTPPNIAPSKHCSTTISTGRLDTGQLIANRRDDVTVSRRHAEFQRDTGEIRVVDIDSLHGTYVNREAVDSVVLTNGDEIQTGKFRLVFLTTPTTD